GQSARGVPVAQLGAVAEHVHVLAEDRGRGGGEAHRDGRTATTRPVPRVAPRHRTRGGGGAGPVGVVLPGDGAGGVLADVLVLHGRVGRQGDRGRPDAGR